MSVKVYNKKKSQSAICEREDWTKCRDHNPSKGWSLNVNDKKDFNVESLEFEEKASGTVTVDSYNDTSAIDDVKAEYENYPGFFSNNYNTRAAALREKITNDIRTQGLGSNFKVSKIKDSSRNDDMVWVGVCESCGEQVTNHKDKGIWEHEVGISMGKPNFIASCPKELAQQDEKDSKATGETTIELDWAFKLTDRVKGKITGNIKLSRDAKDSLHSPNRCNGFTSKGTRCTLDVAPNYSNEYCHLHYRQGF